VEQEGAPFRANAQGKQERSRVYILVVIMVMASMLVVVMMISKVMVVVVMISKVMVVVVVVVSMAKAF
jgi:hypothetical protein